MADAKRLGWVAVAGVLLIAVATTIAVLAGPTRTPPGSDACGELVDKGDGEHWECTFHDDFDGGRLDPEKWKVQLTPASGQQPGRTCPVDDPSTVEVSDGELRLSVRKAAAPLTCVGQPASYASGQVSTHELHAWRYGRFEARVKVAPTLEAGLQEALWMWPAEPPRPGGPLWPAAGEIDIAESYSSHPGYAIPFLHYTANDNGGAIQGLNTAHCAAPRGVWHTYTLEWTPTELRILIDGKDCLVNTTDDPAFDKPFFLVLSAMLGKGRNAYRGAAPLPATMAVDYVRVWR